VQYRLGQQIHFFAFLTH